MKHNSHDHKWSPRIIHLFISNDDDHRDKRIFVHVTLYNHGNICVIHRLIVHYAVSAVSVPLYELMQGHRHFDRKRLEVQAKREIADNPPSLRMLYTVM